MFPRRAGAAGQHDPDVGSQAPRVSPLYEVTDLVFCGDSSGGQCLLPFPQPVPSAVGSFQLNFVQRMACTKLSAQKCLLKHPNQPRGREFCTLRSLLAPSCFPEHFFPRCCYFLPIFLITK